MCKSRQLHVEVVKKGVEVHPWLLTPSLTLTYVWNVKLVWFNKSNAFLWGKQTKEGKKKQRILITTTYVLIIRSENKCI